MSPDRVYERKEVLVSIEGVSLTLDGRSILRNVNARVHNIVRPGLQQGQVVGFLGPSGIGKSQLCRIIAGLQKPDAGTVRLTPRQTLVEVGKVGRVSQTYNLLMHQSVLENLLIAGWSEAYATYRIPTVAYAIDRLFSLEKSPYHQLRERALGFLERFGLLDRADAYPAELSGGQRQRVAIAQQLMRGTQLLLMDEPFTGLDPLNKETVCRLISEVAALDSLFTIIIVAHDISALVSVADTLWLLGRNRDERGQIIPNGGASIQKEYDLIERGLAWQPDIRLLPAFSDSVREVTADFTRL